jgi:hypothetical protein
MRHPVFRELLRVFKRPSADVALAPERVLLVVVDALVFHPPAVRGEDGSALPPAHVRLDARVRVEVPLHVRLDVKALSANIASVFPWWGKKNQDWKHDIGASRKVLTTYCTTV